MNQKIAERIVTRPALKLQSADAIQTCAAATEETSTFTPGPMVELMATRWI